MTRAGSAPEGGRRWGRPHAATARIRAAVRPALASLDPGDLVLVACSGGADSTALAAAAATEARAVGVRVGAVVVDHGLTPGSDAVAATVAERLGGLGLDPVEVLAVEVGPAGEGVEAAAREARYAALDAAADRWGARTVLLGHTLEDQAEQVLLGLARGSGARSLAGMPSARGRLHRPLLGVARSDCRASLEHEGVAWWEDPMNTDPSYARVRARRAVADLEGALGPGLAAALARSADQLRADADLLDALASEATAALGDSPLAADAIAALPEALRTRAWRRLLLAAGAPAGRLSYRHVRACDRLVTDWRGQGAVHVPGGLRVTRSGALVSITPPAPVE